MHPKPGQDVRYPNKEYETLMGAVGGLRRDYLQTKSLEQRKQIASEELAAWKQYI